MDSKPSWADHFSGKKQFFWPVRSGSEYTYVNIYTNIDCASYLAIHFNGEPHEKWLVDINPHLRPPKSLVGKKQKKRTKKHAQPHVFGPRLTLGVDNPNLSQLQRLASWGGPGTRKYMYTVLIYIYIYTY